MSFMRQKSLLFLVATMFPLQDAASQTTLPAITITTPSPVAPKKKPVPKPVKTPSPPAPAETAPPANTENSPFAAAPLMPVTDFSLSIPVDPTFVPVTVLPQTELIKEPGATLGQALENKPGIASTSFAPGASRPVIRGLSGFRVSIQENGLGTGDVSSLSDDHGIPIDPYAAGQVEVVRGPATLRYGSQAIGGVVNATNSRIPDEIPENGFRIEANGGISSVDNGRGGSTMVEAGAGNVVLHADTFARHADDYDTPEGKQKNTRLDSDGTSLGGSVVTRNGYFGVAYTKFDSTYFIPGVEEAEDKNHIDLQEQKWTGKGEWRPDAYGLEAIRVWLGAVDYKHNEVDGLGDDSVIGSTFKNQTYEARLEAQHKPVMTDLGELRGAVGAQFTDRTLSAGGEDGILLPEAKTQNTAGYIFEELQVTQPLRLQFAARIERSNVDGTASIFPPNFLPPGNPVEEDSNRNFLPKSASIGLLYEFQNNIVGRLTAQHVERAPDATELFYKGPHDSTGTFEIGDPNLKIEGANTIEAGLKRAVGDFRFDISAYYTDFGNFIFKRFTGVKCGESFDSCGVGDEFDQIVYSQRDATFYGAELQGEYDIGRIWRGKWGVSGQYDFVHATFDDGSYVPKIPPHRLGGGLYYYDDSWLARVSLLHAFRQDEFAEFDTPTDGYNLLNAEISYLNKNNSISWLPQEMLIGIRGENLLDDDIRNAVSFKKDEVLEPGRNILLFAHVKVN